METAETKTSLQGMKTFLAIWATQVLSLFGSDLSGFALGVWLYEETHQATPFAIAVLFGTLPRVLLSPVAGTIADRFSRRWLMILADLGNALVTLAVALVFWLGTPHIWLIYLVSFVGSVTQAFQEPAYSASVTMLVPKKQLTRAGGLIQLGQSIEQILTPLAAGFLYALIGLTGLFMINFVTCLPAVVTLLIVRIPQPQREDLQGAKGPSMWQDAVFGWKYLAERSGLMGMTWYFALVNFLLNFASVLTVPLVLTISDSKGLGMVQMVIGLSMLLGSLLISVWGGPKKGRMAYIIGGLSLGAIGFMVVGIRSGIIFVAGGYSLAVFVIAITSIISRAITQTKSGTRSARKGICHPHHDLTGADASRLSYFRSVGRQGVRTADAARRQFGREHCR